MSLTDLDREDIRYIAELLAKEFTLQKFRNVPSPMVPFTLLGGVVRADVRTSMANTIWFNASSAYFDHNCVSSSPTAAPGAVVNSRFDATDFVAWIEEEIQETIVRARILMDFIPQSKTKNNLAMIAMNRSIERMGITTAEGRIGFQITHRM